MTDSKTKPTNVGVEDFLGSVSENKRADARVLITIMNQISGDAPVMWGPSIIGFGSTHYAYDTGREGDMPRLGFSPRKASLTIYFSEGFNQYSEMLAELGTYKQSVSCLYINKLADVNLTVLKEMLEQSFALYDTARVKPTTLDEYLAAIPSASRAHFDELRQLVARILPDAEEVFSYGIVGYKVDDKRAKVYISGWKDHVAIYPVPKDDTLRADLKPYIKGKGTVWFGLNKPLPITLIEATVTTLGRE